MPRAGLSTDEVVAAGARLADELGYPALTMGLLADRLGVRGPSLYKHVESLAELQHRIATLATVELGEAIRDAMQGRSGLDALTALLSAVRDYVIAHPGRYTATISARFAGPQDPLFVASGRVLDSIAAVLRSYGIDGEDTNHAIRTLRCTVHGYATLLAADGFQWQTDIDESFRWMTGFLDRGLRAGSGVGGQS